MAKSKRVSVSATKLAGAGEDLEVVGAVAAVEGADVMVKGSEDLAVAQAAVSSGNDGNDHGYTLKEATKW